MTVATQVNLTFHGVGPQRRVLDAGEARVWIGSHAFAEILDAVRDRNDVTLSFDDGNTSDIREALPQLVRRGLRATFFVVAGRIGSPGFLSADDVRHLAAEGMAIGCHGMRHRPWRRLSEADLHEELVDARARLQALAEEPVQAAACPFGAYDRRVLGALRGHGYTRVYTSDGGRAPAGDWLQARTSLGPGDDAARVLRILHDDPPTWRLARGRAKTLVKRWR